MVGSGAGGGVVAGELAQRGRNVLLLEAGGHYTAADFTRFEAKANHTFWSPVRFADTGGPPVALLSASCVGGTTVDQHEGRAARARAGRREVARGDRPHERAGEPFGAADLAPYYDRVEQRLGVRERNDWTKSVYTVKRGFDALGADARVGACVHGRELHALRLVPAGLPDERRQVDAEHLHPRDVGAAVCSTCARTRTSSAC